MGKIHVVKRADAVIRWLERLKKSYADGDTGNAYIEAECARADIEALTHDVIAGLTHSPKRSVMPCIVAVMRVVALSIAVVMSWALPVARDVVAPVIADDVVAVNVVAVNDSLPGMAKTIAAEPRKPQTPRKSPKSPSKPQVQQKTPKATQPVKPAKAPHNDPKPAFNKPAKTPAYDRLAHLTLTGQKALNNDNTTIKLTGRGKNL